MYYIGIMTGNSLDAVDVVITDFEDDIKDICAHSIPIPQHIADSFRILKNDIKSANGDIVKVYNNDKIKFLSLHDEYIKIVAQTVNQTIKKANLKKEDIKAIGFHGQTCYHNPPSINTDNPNTLQIGSGQMLADITGIPVAYDFRSDDIMNGGEGAPLAPIHNQHLALSLKEKGVFPLVFLNAGNTGNLSVISNDKSGNIKTYATTPSDSNLWTAGSPSPASPPTGGWWRRRSSRTGPSMWGSSTIPNSRAGPPNPTPCS